MAQSGVCVKADSIKGILAVIIFLVCVTIVTVTSLVLGRERVKCMIGRVKFMIRRLNKRSTVSPEVTSHDVKKDSGAGDAERRINNVEEDGNVYDNV